MRKPLICLAVVCLVIATMGATEKQETVIPVMSTLHFEIIRSDVIGPEIKYKVTQKTIDRLTRLMKNGGTITLEKNGTLTISEHGTK